MKSQKKLDFMNSVQIAELYKKVAKNDKDAEKLLRAEYRKRFSGSTLDIEANPTHPLYKQQLRAMYLQLCS